MNWMLGGHRGKNKGKSWGFMLNWVNSDAIGENRVKREGRAGREVNLLWAYWILHLGYSHIASWSDEKSGRRCGLR